MFSISFHVIYLSEFERVNENLEKKYYEPFYGWIIIQYKRRFAGSELFKKKKIDGKRKTICKSTFFNLEPSNSVYIFSNTLKKN